MAPSRKLVPRPRRIEPLERRAMMSGEGLIQLITAQDEPTDPNLVEPVAAHVLELAGEPTMVAGAMGEPGVEAAVVGIADPRDAAVGVDARIGEFADNAAAAEAAAAGGLSALDDAIAEAFGPGHDAGELDLDPGGLLGDEPGGAERPALPDEDSGPGTPQADPFHDILTGNLPNQRPANSNHADGLFAGRPPTPNAADLAGGVASQQGRAGGRTHEYIDEHGTTVRYRVDGDFHARGNRPVISSFYEFTRTNGYQLTYEYYYYYDGSEMYVHTVFDPTGVAYQRTTRVDADGTVHPEQYERLDDLGDSVTERRLPGEAPGDPLAEWLISLLPRPDDRGPTPIRSPRHVLPPLPEDGVTARRSPTRTAYDYSGAALINPNPVHDPEPEVPEAELRRRREAWLSGSPGGPGPMPGVE